MSKGINKVILIGRLGNEPDIKDIVTKISLATSENWKDKNGEAQERTEWHKVVFFNKLAEIAGKYLKKGSQVYIEGSLRTTKYTDKESVERYTTEIVANSMQMLDSKGASASDNRSERDKKHDALLNSGAEEFNDDIPF